MGRRKAKGKPLSTNPLVIAARSHTARVVHELKDWLRDHQPEVYEKLQQAAPPADFTKLIKKYNKALKGAFSINQAKILDVWQIMNGSNQAYLLPTPRDSATLFSIQESLELYEDQYTCEDQEETNDDQTVYIPDGSANKGWIPIGWIPNGGEIFIDFCPGPNGKAGQIVENDSEGGFTVLANSLPQYLLWILNSLKSGVVVYEDKFPVVKDSSFHKALVAASDFLVDEVVVNQIAEEDDEDEEEEEEKGPAKSTGFRVTLRLGPGSGRKDQFVVINHAEITPNSTVRQLKEFLHSYLLQGSVDDESENKWKDKGLPIHQQMYLFRGAVLADDKTLAEAQIVHDSAISVAIRNVPAKREHDQI